MQFSGPLCSRKSIALNQLACKNFILTKNASAKTSKIYRPSKAKYQNLTNGVWSYVNQAFIGTLRQKSRFFYNKFQRQFSILNFNKLCETVYGIQTSIYIYKQGTGWIKIKMQTKLCKDISCQISVQFEKISLRNGNFRRQFWGKYESRNWQVSIEMEGLCATDVKTSSNLSNRRI